jgi:hypothetical protein
VTNISKSATRVWFVPHKVFASRLATMSKIPSTCLGVVVAQVVTGHHHPTSGVLKDQTIRCDGWSMWYLGIFTLAPIRKSAAVAWFQPLALLDSWLHSRLQSPNGTRFRVGIPPTPSYIAHAISQVTCVIDWTAPRDQGG